jgi:hypothetical protein
MNFFGTLKRVVELWFRKDGQDVKITPNANTYTGATTFTLPPKTSGSEELVGLNAAQTLTNKTLSSPVINSPTGITKSDVGLSNVDNTSDATKNSATATLTNKTISATTNTISGLANASIALAAGIDVTKLSSGLVTNSEFDQLTGVSSPIQTQLDNKEDISFKGQPNGYAELDAGGKVPFSQLPSTLMEYLGTWDAAANSPTLADGTGDAGDVYIVSVSGTQDLGSGNITFQAGDWVVYNGSAWEKSVNSNAVASVNGFTGAVNLTTSNISEGSNLYFTNGRVDTQVATYKVTNDWTSGTTKSVTHSLGTRNVNVYLYDNTSYETIGVDSVVRTDANTVDLTASEAPTGSGWKVVITKA